MMMLHAIWVLSRARLQIARNTFWRGRLRGKLGLLAMLALLGLAAVGLYNFAGFVVSALGSPELAELLAEAAAADPSLPPIDPPALLAALPSLVMLGALLLMIFSSFSGLLSSLYLSGDMDMLLVAPVPMRAVFSVKFFGGILPQYLLIFALLGPILLGYGQGMGYGPLYLACALLALLLAPLLPAGLGALLVMAVVRVLPPRRAREIVSVIGGLIGVSFYLLSQLSPQIAPALARPETLGALLASDFPLLPSAWAGRALVAAGEGDGLSLAVFGGLFLAASLGAFLGCLALSERLYYAGWSNMATQGGRAARPRAKDRGQPNGRTSSLVAGLAALLPRQSLVILTRDLRLFTRDLRNLQQLIFPLALAAIWTFQLLGRPAEADPDAPAWLGQISDLLGAWIVFFICLSLSGAMAGSGISREGKTFWQLRLAPIAPWRLLLGKLALAYLPYPLAGSLFTLLLGLVAGTGPAAMAQQWLLLQIVGLGCAAFGIGLGAAFPRLDWENPQQQTTWQTGCIGALFYPIYLALSVALVAGLPALGAALAGPAAALALGLLGWVAAAALCAGVVWLSFLIGVRGLERIEV